MVGLKRISTAFVLGASMAAAAQAQGVNQATANAVAETLRSSRSLSGSRIEITTQDGQATLSGVVANATQKAEAVARARQAAGVTGVIDKLAVAGADRVVPAQYQWAHGFGRNRTAADDVIYDGVPTTAPASAAAGAAVDAGPVPEGPAGAVTGAGVVPYPNYAWPSYAPYPNFSAVGYPTVYPWQAWPNIGPFYPYPEVPLDWRAVTARYKDGLWHVKFRKNYTRPFLFVWPVADLLNRNY